MQMRGALYHYGKRSKVGTGNQTQTDKALAATLEPALKVDTGRFSGEFRFKYYRPYAERAPRINSKRVLPKPVRRISYLPQHCNLRYYRYDRYGPYPNVRYRPCKIGVRHNETYASLRMRAMAHVEYVRSMFRLHASLQNATQGDIRRALRDRHHCRLWQEWRHAKRGCIVHPKPSQHNLLAGASVRWRLNMAMLLFARGR